MKEIKRHLKKPIALIVALMMLVTMIPFISAPVHAETEITDVYLLFDEYDFTKFRLGYTEGEAQDQFRNLAKVRQEDEDKYRFATGWSYLVFWDVNQYRGVGYGDNSISPDKEYYLEYRVAPKPGYKFSSESNNMNFYINGVKVTPDKIEYNDGYKTYAIFVPAGPPAEYEVKPQTNVKVKLYGHDDIHVSWDKQTMSGATVKYRVEYKRSTWSNYKALPSGTTTRNYYRKANLVNGARYKFKITPYVEAGGKTYTGDPGESPYIYTLKKIAAPRASKSSRNYVRLRWTNIPGESGYQISRSRYKTKNFKTVKRVSYKYSTTRIKTPRNRTYYYKIRAYKTVDGKRIYAPWSAVRSYRLR